MLYPRQRYFRHYNAYTPSLLDAAIKSPSLTLRKDFDYSVWSNGLQTPFLEIDTAPPEEVHGYIHSAVEGAFAEHAGNVGEFAELYFETLKHVIQRTWNPRKTHVFAVSSGYDSRCILSAVTELYKNGLIGGDIFFFESAGEGPQFNQILDILGWGKDNRVVCYGGKPTEYHAYSFDFDRAHERLNGFISYPVNVWYTPIEWLQREGMIPADDSKIQVFTMYGANETTKACKYDYLGLRWYFWWHYHHQLSAFPLKGEMIHPHYHVDMLKFMEVNREYLKEVPDGSTVCEVICSQLFPELRSVSKLKTVDVKRLGFLSPSREIVQRVENDYRQSWYGRTVCPDVQVSRGIEYTNFWGRWATAGFCEHLIKRGKQIHVEQ